MAGEFPAYLALQRRERWSGPAVTQKHLADALSYSVPLISSWESRKAPKLPRRDVLNRLATLLSSDRSSTPAGLRILSEDELTTDERRARKRYLNELRAAWPRARPAIHRTSAGAAGM